MLTVKYLCINGHNSRWDSQPKINSKMPAGNLMLAATILFTRNTFKPFQALASLLNLKIICESTFYTIQKEVFFPVVHKTWNSHQAEIVNELLRKKLLTFVETATPIDKGTMRSTEHIQ